MASGPLLLFVRAALMSVMDDVIFVAVFVVMMTLAFGYVRLCERIVRSDDGSGPQAQ
jgi:hypothetical protein